MCICVRVHVKRIYVRATDCVKLSLKSSALRLMFETSPILGELHLCQRETFRLFYFHGKFVSNLLPETHQENRIRQTMLKIFQNSYNCIIFIGPKNTRPKKILTCSWYLHDCFYDVVRRRKTIKMCSNFRWSSHLKWVILIYWQRFKAT